MLTEKRHEIILKMLNEKGLVNVSEFIDELQTSESTIRRDLTYLESKNLLKRVHGGAKLNNSMVSEPTYLEKMEKNIAEKKKLGIFAAELVEDNECIYIDSGTTTYEIIEHLNGKNIVVVTNGLKHIDCLIDNNIKCYILGGSVKLTTKAVVGIDAIKSLKKYRFDKCFIGANGVHIDAGLTTPDSEEAAIKETAIELARKSYVICDHSKMDEISFVRFGEIKDCEIITSNLVKNIDIYKDKTSIKVVEF